jgi:hypothetical protein
MMMEMMMMPLQPMKRMQQSAGLTIGSLVISQSVLSSNDVSKDNGDDDK